ncbi:transglycosylase domain-containing protein [Nocardioides mangrovi]|uniref:Penicillin-binding protein n=1 Tax=Nocardioides mangrovi TaxID=2874580 RepID=A0ABS7UB19_9ACTN|nr:transglycosylase domain-containing protein [Nocardioides mangrovi]MBZ5738166.1 penicillin-binding protein [Nocardioides mangrovi]
MTGKRRAAGPAQTKAQTTAPQTKPSATGTKRPRTRKQKVWRVARWFLLAGLVGVLVIVGGFVYLYQTTDIPDPNAEFETQTSFVYYSDGKTEAGSYAIQNRETIPIADMPQNLQDAVVAAENRSFWTDKGIDPKGIIRAAFSNASGNSTQGASTITQQYVKILYLTQERSYQRKIKEAILSLKLQRTMSKTEILEGYLNTIYFGRGAYGVQAAAQAYFDEDAKDLDLRQSAVLASVLNNPTRFDPSNGKDSREALKERYDYVLSGMATAGNITSDEATRAERRLPRFPKIPADSRLGGQKGFMLSMVRNELNGLGFKDEQIDGGGLRITTTFTRKAMAAAAQGVSEVRPDMGKQNKDLHVAVASVEPGTGALRGFYAGQDYLDSQINWAVTGGAPGSTFKAFAVAAGLDEGFSLKDTFDGNSPYYYNGEGTGDAVRNEGTGYDGMGTDYGTVSLLTATEESINTAFADLTMSMDDGPEKILDTAEALGIPRWDKSKSGYNNIDNSPGLEPVSGIALGSATIAPVNMANAYASIANGGKAAPLHVVDKVVDKDGTVLYQRKQRTDDAIKEDVAADTSYALQNVVENGTGSAAQALGRPAAGKTGTATNGNDQVSSSWFVGYTPQLATAVMYVRGKGNEQLDGWLPDYNGQAGYFGANYPTRTWTAVMQQDMEGVPEEDFPEPANLDGEAPSEGHEPYTPPPSPTKKPTNTPSETPSDTPSDTPTESTSPSDTASPSDSPTCGVLGCDSPSDTASPSQGASNGAGAGTGRSGGQGTRERRGRRRG